MKKIKIILMTVFIIMHMTMSALSADALNTGFSTEEYTQEEYNRMVEKLDVRELTDAPRRGLLENYDVSESGLLAVAMPDDDSLGFSESRATVAVYDRNGEYLYGFDFRDTGSMAVEWDGDRLNVYSFRGDCIFTVDDDFQVDELLNVPYTSADNSYVNDHLLSYKKSAGGTDYYGYRGLTVNVSKVVRLDDNGGETVIYESDMGLLSPVLIMGIVIAVICFGGCFLWLVVVPLALIIILLVNKKRKKNAATPPEA